MWDIIVLGTYLILSIVYLWAYLRDEARQACRTPPSASSPSSLWSWPCLVHNGHRLDLQRCRRRTSSGTPRLMGPWFVASALDCGTALVLIVCHRAAQGRGSTSNARLRGMCANLAKMLGGVRAASICTSSPATC